MKRSIYDTTMAFAAALFWFVSPCWGQMGSTGRATLAPASASAQADPPRMGSTGRSGPAPADERAQPASAARQADAAPDAGRAARVTPIVKVFQEASPVVVNLSTTSIVEVRDSFGFGGLFDEIFDFPMSRQPRRLERHSVGSGFVLHPDGYLVTNAHVVDRTSECKVTLADGTELPAASIAIDRKNDLAVLKIETERPLPAVRLGVSNDLMPGETVVAIGNPLGLQHTITTGIISALDRELRFSRDVVYSGLIQTDASINPGNSGGPLLNVLGEVIGINSAIRGDAQNIGFAIPVDRLRELLPEMLDIERLRRVRFGLHFDGSAPDGSSPNDPSTGVRVLRVDKRSPAEKAGVRPGDVINSANGKPTLNFMDLFSILDRTEADGEVKLGILREGRREGPFKVRLTEIPKPDGQKLMLARFGIRVREMTRSELDRLGLRRPVLAVEAVDRASQAFREGVAPGDLITKLGGWPVSSLDSLGLLLSQVKTGDRVSVAVWRVGSDAIVQVEVRLEAQ